MSAGRSIIHPADLMGLKRASGAVIRAIGGVEAAAGHVRIGRSRLSDCQTPHTDAFLPIDVAMTLEAVCPDGPMISAYLARHAGHVLIKLPEARANAGDYLRAIGSIMGGSGSLSVAMATALADRKVDAREAKVLREQIYAVQVHLAGLDAALEAEHG